VGILVQYWLRLTTDLVVGVRSSGVDKFDSGLLILVRSSSVQERKNSIERRKWSMMNMCLLNVNKCRHCP